MSKRFVSNLSLLRSPLLLLLLLLSKTQQFWLHQAGLMINLRHVTWHALCVLNINAVCSEMSVEVKQMLNTHHRHLSQVLLHPVVHVL